VALRVRHAGARVARRRPHRRNKRPVYKTVSKTDAATPETAVEFIKQDTGGQIQRAQGFEVADGGDHCGWFRTKIELSLYSFAFS
jgi:hypothetical protein